MDWSTRGLEDGLDEASLIDWYDSLSALAKRYSAEGCYVSGMTPNHQKVIYWAVARGLVPLHEVHPDIVAVMDEAARDELYIIQSTVVPNYSAIEWGILRGLYSQEELRQAAMQGVGSRGVAELGWLEKGLSVDTALLDKAEELGFIADYERICAEVNGEQEKKEQVIRVLQVASIYSLVKGR